MILNVHLIFTHDSCNGR